MRKVSVNISDKYVKAIDELISKGLYSTKSEAIRIAVRDLILKDIMMLKLIGDVDDEV